LAFFLLRTQRNKATSRNKNNINTNTKEKSKSVNLHTTNHSDTVLRNVETLVFEQHEYNLYLVIMVDTKVKI